MLIEKVATEPGSEAYQRSKQLNRIWQKTQRPPKSMYYFGEYGLAIWGEFGETKIAFTTQQILMLNIGKRYGLGMGMGLDINPSVASGSFLLGNSFFLANRYYFPTTSVSPYLMLDPGYDFIWDGVMTHIGAGLRIPTRGKSINFNVSLRIQQTDIFGNTAKTRFSNAEAIEEECLAADAVIGAVLIPGAAAPTEGSADRRSARTSRPSLRSLLRGLPPRIRRRARPS